MISFSVPLSPLYDIYLCDTEHDCICWDCWVLAFSTHQSKCQSSEQNPALSVGPSKTYNTSLCHVYVREKKCVYSCAVSIQVKSVVKAWMSQLLSCPSHTHTQSCPYPPRLCGVSTVGPLIIPLHWKGSLKFHFSAGINSLNPRTYSDFPVYRSGI